MTIRPVVEIGPIRNGVAARVRALGFAGHGRDRPRAVADVERGVLAWCHGLAAAGVLQESLERRGIEWQAEGEGIFVDPQVLEPED